MNNIFVFKLRKTKDEDADDINFKMGYIAGILESELAKAKLRLIEDRVNRICNEKFMQLIQEKKELNNIRNEIKEINNFFNKLEVISK